MTQPAIKVEGLYKEYVVGPAQARHGTFYDLLSNTLKAPFQRLRNLGGQSPESERFWALRDVNFEVQQGEVLGIIGRNGAGKSTLLKILSRITAPTRGRVTVQGRMASLLEVGTGFHPELSGRENIYLNGSLLGMTRADIISKFDAIVDFSEIEQFIDTPVKRYSSGMYMRLAFSVAAHLDPDILLVDEVLAVGDVEFQQKCLGRLQQSRLEGRTVVFVSHNLAAIQMLCSKVVLIDKGSINKLGAANDMVHEYLKLGCNNLGAVEVDKGCLQLLEAEGVCADITSNDQEIKLRFKFKSIRQINDLLVDFCLENANGQKLVHIMPNARQDPPLFVPADKCIEYLIKIRISTLAPGNYRGVIHAFSARLEGLLLGQSNIPLFRVAASPKTPETAFENFSGALIPGYQSKFSLIDN